VRLGWKVADRAPVGLGARPGLLASSAAREPRPQGGIYPAWGVNLRWKPAEDPPAPQGRQILPRGRSAAVCRPSGAWGFWRPPHLGLTPQAGQIPPCGRGSRVAEAGPPAEFPIARPDSTPVSFFDLHGLPVGVQDVQLTARILTMDLSVSPHGGEPVRAGLQDGESPTRQPAGTQRGQRGRPRPPPSPWQKGVSIVKEHSCPPRERIPESR
jgi:hypothetical protein